MMAVQKLPECPDTGPVLPGGWTKERIEAAIQWRRKEIERLTDLTEVEEVVCPYQYGDPLLASKHPVQCYCGGGGRVSRKNHIDHLEMEIEFLFK
jgi:hypothetical protein